MTAVADSGPVIHLSWIDKLGLLDVLYDEVVIPRSVHDELLASATRRLGIDVIRATLAHGRLRVQDVVSTEPVMGFRGLGLGRGESEALALCQEINAEVFLTDDRAARVVAERLGFSAKGTLGILREARRAGLIDSVVPWALELQRLGQWIGQPIMDELRQEEGQ